MNCLLDREAYGTSPGGVESFAANFVAQDYNVGACIVVHQYPIGNVPIGLIKNEGRALGSLPS
jgi:hypothetical protein